MKRFTAIIISVAMLFGLYGCKDKGEVNSSPSSALEESLSSEQRPSALFSSSAEQPVPPVKEEIAGDSSFSDASNSVNSEANDMDINDSGVVPPSKMENPTGITSFGRKDNAGDNWRMTLVNPWNTLHTAYEVDLSLIDSRFASDKYFDSRAVGDLNAMCAAAAEDGVSLWVISSYRTYDYQQGLFEQEVNEYSAAHPTASKEEAEAAAATEVARPATSEHNLGLAVDFNSVEQSFESTDAYRWLKKNAAEFGFIMRYAASKQSCTGVIYEPWHYRYVGKENADAINKSGLCLEEYIAK